MPLGRRFADQPEHLIAARDRPANPVVEGRVGAARSVGKVRPDARQIAAALRITWGWHPVHPPSGGSTITTTQPLSDRSSPTNPPGRNLTTEWLESRVRRRP